MGQGETVSEHSSIEWTDATWNPVTGCTKVSPGCKFCYAERLSARLQAMGNRRYINGFRVTLHPDQLTLPLRWRRPRRIFVNSMSDLYHEEVPEPFIQQAFDVMLRADWHIYHRQSLGRATSQAVVQLAAFTCEHRKAPSRDGESCSRSQL